MRRQVRYLGRVQGVGFRATAREAARAWPVTGWVRNEADGSVLLEVQGEREAVEGALAGVRRAMGRNITAEESADVEPVAGERGFEIRR